MSKNIWTIEGQLNEAPKFTLKKGRSHAIIRLTVGTGELVCFAHDDAMLRDVRKLKRGDNVRFTGLFEPRDPKLGLNSPYFLNPEFLEKLN